MYGWQGILLDPCHRQNKKDLIMEGFITFLLFFVLFVWGMKRIFPLLLAWLIKRRIQKGGSAGGGFAGPGGFGFWAGTGNGASHAAGNDMSGRKKEEGKVVITDIPQKEKVIDKEVGEYVDFEEQK